LRRSIQFTYALIKRFIPFEIKDVIEGVGRNTIKYKKEAGTKVLASQLFLDCRARRSGAEVGRRNRFL